MGVIVGLSVGDRRSLVGVNDYGISWKWVWKSLKDWRQWFTPQKADLKFEFSQKVCRHDIFHHQTTSDSTLSNH